MTNSKNRQAVGILYAMDAFVLDVMDNDTWLVYGVPDGEFDETSRAEAEANYKEHEWMFIGFDDDNMVVEDFQDFIKCFKSSTRNSRDYDRAQRDALIKEAEDLVASLSEAVIESASPRYLTNEQLKTYIKNRKMNESILLEKSQKSIIKDSRNPKKSADHTFIIKDKNGKEKELTFKEAQALSDEQLANAIELDHYGYYVRRGLNMAKGKEYRHGSDQDEFKGKKSKQFDPSKTKEGKAAQKNQPNGDFRKFAFVVDDKPMTYQDFKKKFEKNGALTIDPSSVVVYDTKKKQLTYDAFVSYRDSQMEVSNKMASATDEKKKKVMQDKKTKEYNKVVKQAIKTGKMKPEKFVFYPEKADGTINKNAKPISYKQWKKKTTDERSRYFGQYESDGDFYSYEQLIDLDAKFVESVQSVNESFDCRDRFDEFDATVENDFDFDDSVEDITDVDYDDSFNIDDDFR